MSHVPAPTNACPNFRSFSCKIDGRRCAVLKSWSSCPKLARLRSPSKPKEEDPKRWEV